MDLTNYRLENLTEPYLLQVLTWRNQPHVREMMYTDHLITKEEHEKWFENVIRSNESIVKLLFYQETPLGLVQFNHIHERFKRCYWGFYIGEKNPPNKTGTALGILALDYIFLKQGLEKVLAEVIENNTRSFHYHKKLGFVEEGRFIKHIIKHNQALDVIPMALFNDEWQQVRTKLKGEV
ncbi:UDP-4-amino-4,6-dideoxy-N-acetyl-beta-L-altrosamine N-acetyltransferase [Alkalibacillus silvisoli]|uniref:N-acetyltransferase domain-containing protein n=1 Tax=Alkalibacillus silvisoli TaxID=392823 RepID=A0ABN0ZNS9_9BACI